MGFGTALTFYAVIGLAVAAADYLGGPDAAGSQRWFRGATAAMFWPLFLPVLLSRSEGDAGPRPPAAAEPIDGMAAAIAQVEIELDAALSSLDGWAESVLAREKDRLGELRGALASQAARIREMDALVAGFDDEGEPALALAPAGPSNDRCQQSEQARRQNLARLRGVRRRAYDDLMGTLAWVRELVSMIHLAKFTGAPASRAEELVAQIAAAVEGVSELRKEASRDVG
ncbi:MAG TPA: hypothetical protein VMV10_23625 [Pirellulales bacterium]|nr:hypothetical protein [Pirellulales bacterium]